MPPQNAPMLQPDGLSASESSDSGGMSIDSQDYQVKNKTHLSSMKSAVSDGISRFCAQWRVLLLGQFLSILLASSVSFSSSMHVQCNVSAPAMQTAIVFFLMSFHVWPVLLRKRKEKITTSNENDLALGESTSIDSSSEILRSTSTRSFGSTNVDESQITEPHTMCCRLISVSLPWWVYAGFACVLVEASFFTFLAYRYTSLTSASILDNTNIFAAMLGSRIILKRRYSTTHILGALICCIGVILNITSDVKKAGEDASVLDDDLERISVVEYPNRMFGDAMAILGGCMVGLCDVTIERIVKDFVSVDEYIGFVGLFGTVVASIQAFALEYRQIAKIFGRGSEEIMTTEEIYETYLDNPFDAPRSCKQETAIWLVIGYALTTYLLNYCMARFLAKSESALLTLSLLTADLFAVIFSIVAEHYIPPTLFYVGLVLVLIGVIVYEMAPSPLGIAEDLVMSNEGIVIERGKLQEMKNTMNVEVSWNAADGPSGDQHDNDIERREIL